MSATWDSRALKAVPLTADEVLIIDTADSRNQKRATIASMPFGITTSNVGLGEGLALLPVVNDFPFKSLIGTAPIALAGNANDITFTLNALTNANIAVGIFPNITGLGVQTQELDMDGNTIIMDADGDSSISASVDDQISFQTTGTERMRIEDNTIEIFDVLRMNGNAVSLSPLGSTSISSAAGEQILSFNVNGVSAVFFQLSGSTFNLPVTMNAVGISNATFIESNATNPADAGFSRLGVLESHAWRNNANDGNLLLGVNTLDELIYQGNPLGLYDSSSPTEIISGEPPVPSATVGSVDVQAMRLLFTDYSVSAAPVRTVVDIAAQTVANPLVATSTVTRMWINSAGVISFTDFTVTLDQRDFILLGSPQHFDNVNITGIGTAFEIFTQNDGWLPQDLTQMLGLIKSGMEVSGRGGDLGIDIGVGNVFLLNGNQLEDNNHRNIIPYTASTLQPSMALHIRTGQSISFSNVLDPTQWDNNGVQSTVSNNNFTNMRIWLFPSGKDNLFAIVQLGQREYNSLAEAETGAATDSYTLNPVLEGIDIGLAIISIKKEATQTIPDGVTVSILNMGKFGFIGASGGGQGGVSQTPILQDIEYAGFDIKNISNVEFQNTTLAPGPTIPAIWFDTTFDDMTFNVPTGTSFDWSINGTVVMRLSNLALNMSNVDIRNVPKIHSELGGNDESGFINMLDTELVSWESTFLDTANTIGFNNDIFEITYETSLEYTFSETVADFNGNNLIGVSFLQSSTANPAALGFLRMANTDRITWRNSANDNDNSFGFLADVFEFAFDSVQEYEFTVSEASFKGNGIVGLGYTDFGDLASPRPTTARAIWGTIPDGLIYHTPTATTHDWQINGVSEMELSSTQLDMKNGNIRNFNFLEEDGTAALEGEIRLVNEAQIRFRDNSGSLSGYIEYNVNDEWRLGVSNVAEYDFTSTFANFRGNDLINVNRMQFNSADTDTYIWNDGTLDDIKIVCDNQSLMRWTAEPSGNIVVLAAARFNQAHGGNIVSASEITSNNSGNTHHVTGTTTINTINPTDWVAGAILNLIFDDVLTVTHNSGGTNDILLGDATNFTTAAGDVLTVVYDNPDWIELSRSVVASGGGASQTPILQDVDYDGFDINDLSNILFRDTTSTPATSTFSIYKEFSELSFNVATGGAYQFYINGAPQITVAADSIDINDAHIIDVEYIESGVTTPALTGFLRLGNNQTIEWKDNGGLNEAAFSYSGTNAFNFKELDATPLLELEADHTSPINGSFIGELSYWDDNSIGTRTKYGRIATFVESPTNSNEVAEMQIGVVDLGTMNNMIILNEANDKRVSIKTDLNMDTNDVLWRNNADTGDLLLDTNASDQLVFNGTILSAATSVTAIAQYTNTDITTNLNVVTPIELPIFGTQEILDTGFTLVGQTLRCDFTGTVLVHCNVWAGLDTAGFRTNFQLEIRKNSTNEAGVSQGDYIRNTDGNNRASTSITKYVEVVTNDTISIMASRGSTTITDAVDMTVAGNSFISVTRVK